MKKPFHTKGKPDESIALQQPSTWYIYSECRREVISTNE